MHKNFALLGQDHATLKHSIKFLLILTNVLGGESIMIGLQIRVCNKKNNFYFSTKTYVVCTQKIGLNETVLLGTQNICLEYSIV